MMNNNIYDVPTSTDQLVSGNKMYLGSRAGQRMDCNGYLRQWKHLGWRRRGKLWIYPHISKWSGASILNGICSYFSWLLLLVISWTASEYMSAYIFWFRESHEGRIILNFVQMGFVWVVKSRDTLNITWLIWLGLRKRVNQLLQTFTSWMGC